MINSASLYSHRRHSQNLGQTVVYVNSIHAEDTDFRGIKQNILNYPLSKVDKASSILIK